MSDTEQPPVEETKPAKKERKKRVLTEEQKEKLREQLRKGRETALKNRQKKALEKKIDREEKEKARDEKIAKAVLGKSSEKEEIKELKEQIKTLKAEGGHNEEIKELRAQIKMLGDVLQGVIDKNNAKQKESAPPLKPTPVSQEVKEEPQPKQENTKLKEERSVEQTPAQNEVVETKVINPKPPPPKVFDATKNRRNQLRGFF